ncbi:hypothetical protein PanWU01x14_044410 [Parasponia andersonii]|uniref:DOMON domain containing protein n=1 Tax=Parasponia andersonii TaxID=3476 RepID=A0A2P5DP77_PARAD|nr:hypothetical protein PanWU01x14_044410 [Parasponia andersonii]
MGSLHLLLLPTFSLWAVTVVLLVSPVVHALMTCSTIKLPTKRHYSDCLELPTLDSYLHWTYNRTNLTLSLAFTAPQPKPEGWVTWALNPTSNGMVGLKLWWASNILTAPSPQGLTRSARTTRWFRRSSLSRSTEMSRSSPPSIPSRRGISTTFGRWDPGSTRPRGNS